MSRFVALFLLCCTAAACAACSTISGFGKDVEAIGGGVAAEPAKKR
ncbi:MAG: entericidin [Pseudomonadota bacterium]|nr:entericidin [Pseudomonadota bacterium]